MRDVKDRTTYDLEHVINAFTWYENRYLARVKRELDKRYRLRTIKKQYEALKKEMKNNIKKK
tara:strand:- start:435 stop:620 length:186 start_codon:yes stop_codon:yes gene_type:complete